MTSTPRALAISVLLYGSPSLAAPTPGPDYDAATSQVRKLLGELVAADTSNPPGNEARAVALGAARLKEAGLAFQTYEFAPGRENLVARLRGDGTAKPLLLLAHIDVVGTQGQPWTSPPHQVTERDGYLTGRGVQDDLSMAAIELEVLLLLHRAKVPLKRDVILAWTGDEESGGRGVRYLLERAPASIGDAVIALNEGDGPVLGPNGQWQFAALQTAEKAYQDFVVRARGTTGHSSVPMGDNAIYRLASALEKLGRHKFPARLLPATRSQLAERAATERPALAQALRSLLAAKGPLPADALAVLDQEPQLAALVRTTCVATEISGGTRANALPAEATANVNCRILPDETVADVRRQLAEVFADPAVDVAPTAEFGQGGASPVEGEVPRAVRAVVGRLHPKVPVLASMSLGATDSRFLRRAGIAAYGFRPVAVTEENARRAHGIDERIPVSSLRPAVELFYDLVIELAAKPAR